MASEPTLSALPPGEHSYEAILADLRRGRYRFARIRAASGRLHFLIGLSPEQLDFLRAEASRRGIGLILHGSRISGPRIRQRELDPVLKEALPLSSTKRRSSSTYPGGEGLHIDKTKIKEYGLADPRTSDLTVFVVDHSLDKAGLDRLAAAVEARLRGLGCSFPIRVFSGHEGRVFRNEADFIAMGADYLRRHLPQQTGWPRGRVEQAFKELYAAVNLPRSPFVWADAGNGLLSAVLLSISFYLTLGLHPVVPAMGFLFGFSGRYLARFRAWIAREPADTFLSNTAALAADAAMGTALMALIINPAAAFGIPLRRIIGASLLHTLSKGAIRLWLDKKFSQGPLARQKLGIVLSVSISFLQGLATAYVYTGSWAAVFFQAAMACAGLALVYGNPIRQAAARRML